MKNETTIIDRTKNLPFYAINSIIYPTSIQFHYYAVYLASMLLAHHLAGWSKERGRRVGAVIVGPDNAVRSTGFNGFARGVNEEIEHRHSRDTGEKYFWSCHAEQNAIYNAARVGVPLSGCKIYVPWFPCVECAKGIIQSGLSELICYAPDLITDNKWGEDFRRVTEMLHEGRVKVRERLMDLRSG